VPYHITLYESASGRCDIRDFLDGLDEYDRIKCEASIAVLGDEGPALRRPQADHVKGDIRELRPRGRNSHYRLLYAKLAEDHYLICNAFKKNKGPIPLEKIRQAEERLAEVKKRS
jgi:phage-related protein